MNEDDFDDEDDLDYDQLEDDYEDDIPRFEEDDMKCDFCGATVEEVRCPECNGHGEKFNFHEPLSWGEREFVNWLKEHGVEWYEANSFLRAVANYIKTGQVGHLP